MPQTKLIKAEQVENGIRLTFLDDNNKEVTGIYNNGKLKYEEILQLIDNDISFSGFEKDSQINIHKAWNQKGSPTYCDDPFHALDR